MGSDLKFLIFSLAAIALSFGLGLLLGTNNFMRRLPPQSPDTDPLHQLVQSAKPNSNFALIFYKGTLSELSPQKIVLVNDQGQTVTFSLDTLGALSVHITYQKRLSGIRTERADASIFTPGVRLSLTLSVDFATNQIKEITLTKE